MTIVSETEANITIKEVVGVVLRLELKTNMKTYPEEKRVELDIKNSGLREMTHSYKVDDCMCI